LLFITASLFTNLQNKRKIRKIKIIIQYKQQRIKKIEKIDSGKTALRRA
jgi:hypothetical protein